MSAQHDLVVGVKRTRHSAYLPIYSSPVGAGADLYSTENIVVPAHGKAVIPIGIEVEVFVTCSF